MGVRAARKDFATRSLKITTLYVLPLGLIWLTLWVIVSSARSKLKCSIGDGNNSALLQKIRWHGNFTEWAPLTLLLMILAEAQGADAAWLHGAGALLLIGRIAHPFGLAIDNAGHPLRYVGNGANLLAVIILLVWLARLTFGF